MNREPSIANNVDDKFNNTIIGFLEILIIFISLFTYKGVISFRCNQQFILIIFTILLITLYFLKSIFSEKITWINGRLNLPIYIFIALLTISLFLSKNIEIGLNHYLRFISYLILFFIVLNTIKEKGQFDSFIRFFFITSFLVALYTIIQYYGLDPYYGYLGQLTSTIGQKNWLSNYLALIFPIIFSFFLLENNRRYKIILFLSLLVLYTTLIIGQSRGIWISIITTLLFALFLISRYRLWEVFRFNKRWLIVLLTIFLVITVIYSTENPINKSRLTAIERAASTFDKDDPSINTRFLIWRTALEIIKDKPILGLGIGTFSYHYLDYQAAFLVNHPEYIKYNGKAAEAHNEYLHLAAETGITGLFSLLAIIFVFYYLIYQYLEREKNKDNIIIIFGLLMGITCFLIHCLFTFPFHVPVLGTTFFILLGLTITYINLSEKNEGKESSKSAVLVKFKSNTFYTTIVTVMLIVLAVTGLWKIALKPYLAEHNYFKGANHFAEQENGIALEYFKRAAQYDSNNGRILHALGSAYYQLDLQEEAQKILQKTTQIYRDRNTFRNLGLSYRQSGDFEQAEKQFQQAIYLDPKYYVAYHDLASLYVYLNEYEKAIEQWQRAIDLGLEFEEKNDFLYYIGLGYQQLNSQ